GFRQHLPVIAGLDPAIQCRMFLKISAFRLNGRFWIIGSSPIMTESNISDGFNKFCKVSGRLKHFFQTACAAFSVRNAETAYAVRIG
ncbi:hypothetical protein, partial [Neisseria dentiae]|uniref:hypothetical protein n=1 Tax=Neisseria dentiae TaxID=194197 RepID=UPI0035A1B758